VLIHHMSVEDLLSFGAAGIDLPLGALNVLIGPNGSGKSNLIDVVSLLQAAPRHLSTPIQENGGIADWLWKGASPGTAAIDVAVEGFQQHVSLSYSITFAENARRLEIIQECIKSRGALDDEIEPNCHFSMENGRPKITIGGIRRSLERGDLDLEQSILSQRKDPEQYPEITYLGEQFDRIRIYREWSFGRNTASRLPQKADQRNDFLAEDCSNLGLVLNRLRQTPTAKTRILEMLGHLYPEFSDFDVSIEGNTVQVFFTEGDFTVPATRLSDGTLRYLCLLAVLCHPKPPPLVCIEEPELGLHPDIMAKLAELMKEASQRTQLIVTTHSEALIDALSDSPEDVVVCEKHDGETTMNRLDGDALKAWLDRYSLGQLWTRGEIGGNRW